MARDPLDRNDEVVDVAPPLLGKSKVLFTGHALLQMALRGITQRTVLQVIRTPHEYHDADFGRTRARRIRAGGTSAVDVVYEIDLDQVIVVTAIVKQFKKR